MHLTFITDTKQPFFLSFSFLRHIKLLETLREMISSLPINDVTSEELFVNLEKIRAKYKQVGTRWSYTDELMCLEILNMNEDHFFFHHSSKILVIW